MIIDSPIISGSNAASGSFNQFGNINVTGSLTVSSSTFTANNNVVLGTNSSNTVVVNSTIDSDIVPYEGGARNLGSNSAQWNNVYAAAFTGSLFGTASYAATASYATNAGAGAGFPFSGSAQITGSLLITELSGSGVRYLTTDNDGLIVAQTASAAIKTTQAVTSTAGQTSFNITNGYTTGLVDVFINGTKLSAAEFTDTSGTVITLATGSNSGDVVEFVKYFPASGVTNNALRQLTTFTASAGQTVFSASYTPGLLDIYYNGARLSTSDYTANNGTYFTLATASVANDILDVLVYSYQVGAFSGIGGQGVTSQIAYFNTTSSITGSNNFTISGSTMTVTGSLLVSGSGTFTNIGPAVMSGSLNVSGAIVTNSTITAQTLVVQTITSSVSVITGSTNWGSLSSNTHTFTGSMAVSGSGAFIGNITASRLLASDTYANDPIVRLVTTTSGNVEVQLRTATTTYNPGIGVVTSGYDFNIFTNNTTRFTIRSSDGGIMFAGSNTTTYLNAFIANSSSSFAIYATEGAGTQKDFTLSCGGSGGAGRIIIAANGFTKYSSNNVFPYWANSSHEISSGTNSNYCTILTHQSTLPYGLYIAYTNASATGFGTTNEFLGCADAAQMKAIIYGNGTFGSRTSTYGGISDLRLKENITPATSKLDDLMKVNVVNYNFIDDGSKEKQLGVIAQELEEIFPNMVFEAFDRIKNETYKNVKYSIFTPMLIKAIQEQQATITSLQTRIEQLENK